MRNRAGFLSGQDPARRKAFGESLTQLQSFCHFGDALCLDIVSQKKFVLLRLACNAASNEHECGLVILGWAILMHCWSDRKNDQIYI